MPSIVTLGSATRDTFLFSKAFKIIPLPGASRILAECVTLGEKIDLDDLVFSTGGGATNAATTFARLGFETHIVTRVGDDESGRSILQDLQSNNINTAHVVIAKKERTAHSTILTAETGERTVLVFRGASAAFSPKDIKLSRIKASAIYLTSLAGNIEITHTIAQHCKQKGLTFIWNPGHAELKTSRGLEPIRKLVNILLVNLEEAQMLTGKNIRDPKVQCELLGLPGSTVVVTDGQNGAFAHRDKTTWHCRTSGVSSVSRTGAGDAFGSAFSAAILQNMPIEDALRLGTMNAESVVQKIGAKAGILRAWPTAAALSAYRIRKI